MEESNDTSGTITVNVLTLQKTSHPLKQTYDSTVQQLKELATQEQGQGVMIDVAYKGTHLKDPNEKLESAGLRDGCTVVGIFRKKKEKTKNVETKKQKQEHVQSPTREPTKTSSQPTNTTEQNTNDNSSFLTSWSCPYCTYVNIAARTVCEICNQVNPTRRVQQNTLNSPPSNSNSAHLSTLHDKRSNDSSNTNSNTITTTTSDGEENDSITIMVGGKPVVLSPISGNNIEDASMNDANNTTAKDKDKQTSKHDTEDINTILPQITEEEVNEIMERIHEDKKLYESVIDHYNLSPNATDEQIREQLTTSLPLPESLLQYMWDPNFQDQINQIMTSQEGGEQTNALFHTINSILENVCTDMDEDMDEDDTYNVNIQFDDDPW